ncbi:hypothetical protein ACKI1O_52220, partial [Streptomyces scabiei]
VITFLYFLFGGAFPDSKAVAEADEKRKKQERANNDSTIKSNLWLDGTLFIIYGYIFQATFYVSQMLTQYGQEIGHMAQGAAH